MARNPYRSKTEKYESCVKQVKPQKGYNPYAVCRSSVFGVKKGNTIHISKEEPLYYDNEKSGNRERFDGKSGKLTNIYDDRTIEVTFKDGSKVRTPKAYVNYGKTPEYKKSLN